MVVKIDSDLCDGCGICIEDCPTEVLKLDQNKNKAVIVYGQDCWDYYCCLCEDRCPNKALQVLPLPISESERPIARKLRPF